MNINTSTKKILSLIFLTILIDMLGIGILIPVFPLLVAPSSSFKITPADWSSAQNYILAGWLMAAFPLAQFFATPILGQLADRYGRRKVLAFSISGTAISYLLFALGIVSRNLPLLFFSRILDGASGGNISIAQAVIADVSEPAQRAKNFGLIGVALGSGFVVGPFIGGKLSDPGLWHYFNAATPFWFAAGLSALNMLLVVAYLPETLRLASTQRVALLKPLWNILKIVKFRQLNWLIPLLFLFNSGFTFFTTFWGIILAERFGFAQGGIGNFFAYLGLMIILAQGMLVRRMSSRWQDYQVLRYSILAVGGCLILFDLIPPGQGQWIYFLPPLLAVAMALTKAFGMALLARLSPPDMRAEVMGINSSYNALAQSIPALLAGYIAVAHTSYTILVGGLLILVAGALYRLKSSSLE